MVGWVFYYLCAERCVLECIYEIPVDSCPIKKTQTVFLFFLYVWGEIVRQTVGVNILKKTDKIVDVKIILMMSLISIQLTNDERDSHAW